MSKDNRDLLQVLKAELEFVEKGGYRNTARPAWRPHFIFQDSPTCLNFDPAVPPRPCAECVLMQVIPEAQRGKKIACRYIPLNEQGDTLDSLYRYGTPEELEAALRHWLGVTIDSLEKTACPEMSGVPEIHVRAKMVLAE